ncbi:hypothetical protein L7F22_064578 [Adiantum nelumboides]|nr:hypothetical protein [Adiantum nelumboides]
MECLSKGRILQGPPCSVCLEAVNDASERSIAKLICGHQFHLDCIGSAFNAKGSMQCPNCRRVENGQWLYANGVRQYDNSSFEDIIIEEEYDLFAGAPEFLLPHEYLVGHIQWSPYQSSYAQVSLSVGDADNHLSAYPDLVVDVMVGSEDNVRVQESGARSQHGAWHSRQYPSSREQWGYQFPAALASIGVAAGVGPTEGSRRPHVENHAVAHECPPQARYHGRRQSINSAQFMDNRQFSSASWDYAGQSVWPSSSREPEPRNNAAFFQRRQGVSAFREYPTEREGQRWAPPPLSGLYGSHGILGSELPTQARIGGSALQNHGRFQESFQAFQPYENVEPSIYPS